MAAARCRRHMEAGKLVAAAVVEMIIHDFD